jgi:glyoxylase-like metal-dependent hydrolase (beta-lactamase superfamily II)
MGKGATSAADILALTQSQGIRVHAFLLAHKQQLVLIDTLFSADAAVILNGVASMGRSVKDLKHIVLTHAHRAHLGGLARLKQLSDATVYCHEWEADIVAGDRPIQQASLLPRRPFRIWPSQVAARFLRHKPCKVDQWIKAGDKVGPLDVIHTPGHTPGHLAFFWPEKRAVFAGDALVTYPQLDEGWAGFMLNAHQNRNSVQVLAALNPDYVGVGHGSPIESGAAPRLRALADRLAAA